MKTSWKMIVLASTLLMLTGCARSVLRTGDRGVVAIPANTNAWPLRYR